MAILAGREKRSPFEHGTGHVVGARIRPEAMEAAYRIAAIRADGRDAAIVIGVFTALTLPFLYSDLVFAGGSGRLGDLLAARMAYLLTGVVAVWVGLRVRQPSWLDRSVLLHWVAGAIFTVVLQSTRPDDYYLPVAINAVAVLLVWAVVPIGYLFQTLGAGAVTASCLAWLVAYRRPPPVPVALVIGFTLVVANLAGAYVSWRLQRSRRLEFLAVRKQAEAILQLRSSESLFRAAFEGVSIGKALCDLDGRFLRVNDALCRFLGCPSQDLLGRTITDVTVPGDREAVLAGLATLVGGGAPFRREARHVRPEGEAPWGDLSMSLVRDPDGSARYVVCSLVDVDERHRAEEALATTRSRYAELHEGLGDGVASGRPDGSLVEFNEAFRRMVGYTREELLTMRYQDLTPERWHAEEARRIAELVGARGRVATYEKEYRRKDGTVFPVEVRAFARHDGERLAGLWATVRDISAEKAMREQLAVASRLAAMGTLVAGVAHEINNPLVAATASNGFVAEEVDRLRALLETDAPVDRGAESRRLGEVAEALHDAQEGTGRIAAIVRDLTLLGRPDARRTRVSLRRAAEDAIRWLPAELHERARFRIEDHGVPEVQGAEGQVRQVLVNLLGNAARAARDGQPVSVRVVLGPGGPGTARVDVIDDGVGMTPEVLGHMFDPFFTTRGVGRGMGLGLAICHAIVTAHGGTIGATSTPGEGSTLRVELPRA